MYKILIVDDEKMIRMGMKKVLPWNVLGISEVFTAASGREALEIMREHHPEIMVTDINMTEMTGLVLIEEARKIQEELRVIVLTGYDNFEYARQSLRLQVQDFFLKPIEEKELAKVIREQVDFLENQKNEELNMRLLQRTQGSSEQLELENCMRRLVRHSPEEPELLRSLKDYYVFDTNKRITLALIVPTLYTSQEPEKENFRAMSVKNVCIGMVDAQQEGITFSDDDGTIGIAYFQEEEDDSVMEALEELSDILEDEFDAKPKMVLGSSVSGFANLYISYNDAKYLLENEKEGIRDIVQTLGAQKRSDIFRDIYTELKGIMCNNVGNTDYVLKAYNTFAKATESYNLSPAMVRRCCFEVASALSFSYMGDSGEVEPGKLDALSKSLLTANKEEACEVTHMYISSLLGKEEENVHEIITKAKHYIDEHLIEELSVSNIAADLYITPNYFSRLFKRVTKEGCNEYIVRKRIEKAKSLLETTSLKTGKIAMMVGYRDTNYFSLAFKKHTGKSPTKYREDCQH